MRVLASGLTTDATTLAGGAVRGAISGEAVGPGEPSQRIAGVFLSWASSAPSTVAIRFLHGRTSAGYAAIPLAVPDSSASNNVFVPLGVTVSQWDISCPTTMAKGLVAIVYAE